MLRLPTLEEYGYTGPGPLVGSLADWSVLISNGETLSEQAGGRVYSEVYKLAVIEAGPVDFRGIGSVFPNLQALLVADESPNSTDIRGVIELAGTLTHLELRFGEISWYCALGTEVNPNPDSNPDPNSKPNPNPNPNQVDAPAAMDTIERLPLLQVLAVSGSRASGAACYKALERLPASIESLHIESQNELSDGLWEEGNESDEAVRKVWEVNLTHLVNLRALALAKGDFCTLEELNLASPKRSLQALVLPSGVREVSMGASPGTFNFYQGHGSFTTALRDELRGRGPHTLTLTLHSEEKPTRRREAAPGKGRRRGGEGGVTADGAPSVCASCELNLPGTSFTKNQLSKGMARRCTTCVDSAQLNDICASCERNLPETSFTKNQRSKGMAPRCTACMDSAQLICASCERNLPGTSFSKNQRSKGVAPRCTACVDSDQLVCASCDRNRPGKSFTTNQLSKGMARRCKDCVGATSTRPAPPSSGEALFQPARDLLEAAMEAEMRGNTAAAVRLAYAAFQHSQTRGGDPALPSHLRKHYALTEREADAAMAIFGEGAASLGPALDSTLQSVNYELGLEGDGPNACRDRFLPDGTRLTPAVSAANMAASAPLISRFAQEVDEQLQAETVGKLHRIRGLKAPFRTDMNGATGVCVEADVKSDHYVVRVTAMPDGSKPPKDTSLLHMSNTNMALLKEQVPIAPCTTPTHRTPH